MSKKFGKGFLDFTKKYSSQNFWIGLNQSSGQWSDGKEGNSDFCKHSTCMIFLRNYFVGRLFNLESYK